MLEAYALTDIGRKRAENQDYIFSSTDPVGAMPGLFVLADGMGGHRAGSFASRYLVESMVDFVSHTAVTNASRVLTSALRLSNTLIHGRSNSNPELEGMGTTLVAAIIQEDHLTVQNVGDSRLYLISGGIRQITRDHSYVEEMVSRGLMVRGSAEYNKRKNIITRAVGVESRVQADLFEEKLKDGDYILMCSDGLTNMVDDDSIYSIISGNGSIRYKVNTLIETANDNGGKDNIAVILIRYRKDGDMDV